MESAVWRLRAALLVFAGALVVHEARYWLAGVVADEHAHSYLSWLGPLVCGAVVLAVAELAFRVVRRQPSGRALPVPGLWGRWLGFWLLLLAIFAAQELIEMLAVHGHVDPAESLVAHGGWIAGPLAALVGGVVALLLRGAAVLLARAARARARLKSRPGSTDRPAGDPARPRLNVLARKLAGRAPPPSFVT